jgi:hypothetical protein
LLASKPYNTLAPGTDESKLSSMVVELLLTGQNLYPFNASYQYAVASAVNNLLSPYPHIVALGSTGVTLFPSHPCFSVPHFVTLGQCST